MKTPSIFLALAFCGLIQFLLIQPLSPQTTPAQPPTPVSAKRVDIVLGVRVGETEQRVAEVLQKRMLNRSKVSVAIIRESELKAGAKPDLSIYLGLAANHDSLAERMQEAGIARPDGKSPGPEGFLLAAISDPRGPAILAAGVDRRGVLYAAGEILRRLTYLEDAVTVSSFSIRTAPAYRWRGSSANQGGTMQQLVGARGWTNDEHNDCALDYALAGANTFYAGGDFIKFIKQFDLKFEYGCRPNELPGSHPEWRRKGTDRGPYVCPSIPEARAALLAYYDTKFKEAPDADVLRFFAGDPGGCRCDKCQPWGKTFVLLCEELTATWKKYHPNSEVEICNQDLDNAGDEAIFSYLNEKPRTWLTSLSYGPGSNAMSHYFRDELRDDLFAYPGDGPVNRYLAYTLHSLPKQVSIVHYSDITHWISAQYMVTNPEPTVAAVYGRRTFHQRPKAFYKIFHEIMPFSEGDIVYSEGHHDELHQYLWNRMLWHPDWDLDELMMEYATYHFGKWAAPEMMEASYQLEKDLEAPLATNQGIDRYYSLVKNAGEKIPPNLLALDYRWREHMQKAALDKYFQMKLKREHERQEQATATLTRGLEAKKEAGWLAESVSAGNTLLTEPMETAEMKSLREEALRVADESNKVFGIKNTGLAAFDADLTGSHWLAAQVKRALEISDAAAQRSFVDGLVHYEDAGEGGFYDDAGSKGRQPHLTRGQSAGNPAQFRTALDPNNRPSANSFAYNQQQSVVFSYTGLDPNAQYKVKVTLVAPRRPPSADAAAGDARPTKRMENIVVDDVTLAPNVEIPLYTAKQFEFDVPRSVTSDGAMELKFEKASDEAAYSATIVSEVWVMKKK